MNLKIGCLVQFAGTYRTDLGLVVGLTLTHVRIYWFDYPGARGLYKRSFFNGDCRWRIVR
jgi:hypothetical protein